MKMFTMLGVVATLMGCVPIPVTISAGKASPQEAPLPTTAPAIRTFDQQFTAQRASQGLQGLRSNSDLDRIALAHSQDMVANGYLSHVDRSGRRAQARVRNAGITNCGIGENVAQGQNSVEEVVAAWMASPGHRRNMLNRDYASYGIGRVGDTWTLIFALPC